MKILLAGDSWTFRPRTEYYVPGPTSIADFLIQFGHNVTNIARPGRSNFFIINKMQNVLSNDTFDKIIFVQTDPLRDHVHANANTGWEELLPDIKWFDDYKHLQSIMNNILDKTYKSLNDIGLPINLIGGCSKVNVDLISKYSNLSCLMPSIPEFLQPGYNAPEIWGTSRWQKKIDKKWDLETIDYILNQIKSTEWLHNNCPHFLNDLMHPDVFGYKKVAEYISDYLKT